MKKVAVFVAKFACFFYDIDESNVTIMHLIICHIHYDSFMPAFQVYTLVVLDVNLLSTWNRESML